MKAGDKELVVVVLTENEILARLAQFALFHTSLFLVKGTV